MAVCPKHIALAKKERKKKEQKFSMKNFKIKVGKKLIFERNLC